MYIPVILNKSLCFVFFVLIITLILISVMTKENNIVDGMEK